MQLSIRQATSEDTDAVADILREAAGWLEERRMPLWRQDELLPNCIAAEVDAGQFFLAECDGDSSGNHQISNLRTGSSGPMSFRMTRRSFIDSLSSDVLLAARFLRR